MDISIDGCCCIFGVVFSLSDSDNDRDIERLDCADQARGDGTSDEVDLSLVGVMVGFVGAGFCVTRFGLSNLDETEVEDIGSTCTSEFNDLLRLENLSLSDFSLDLVGKSSVSCFWIAEASVLFWLLGDCV